MDNNSQNTENKTIENMSELLLQLASSPDLIAKLLNLQATTPQENTLLFKDYCERYFSMTRGSVKSRTYGNNISIRKHILDGLGHLRMSEISKSVLMSFINNFATKTYQRGNTQQYYSQSTINKVYDLLRGIVREASNEDGDRLLKFDFMANIEKPRSRRYREDRYASFSEEEILQIARTVGAKPMVSMWIHILLYAGTRPSEALALKFSDIDYEKKTIQIVRTLSHEEIWTEGDQKRRKGFIPIITNLKNDRSGNKVNYQRRVLTVGEYLLTILREWERTVKGNRRLMKMKRENGTEEYLFCGSKGQLWLYEDYKQEYDRLMKRAGVDTRQYNPYRFRHNYCTTLLRHGVDIKTVQRCMGDNTADMVLRVYANMDTQDMLSGSHKMAQKLDDLFAVSV